jgi:hypothetical protein
MSQNPNLFLSLGKQVKDEYGCTIGKIASFAVTPSGKFDSVFIERGDGRISKHSSELLKLEGASVTLTSNIKAQAGILCDQIPLIWRKEQALRDLSEKKKISKEMYTELHTSFDGVLAQLKTEAQALTEDIDNEVARCVDETTALNYAFVHLELEHEIGKLDNQSYETAFAIVQESLKRVHLEKTDLDLTRSKLSNILLGDQAKSKGIEGSKAASSASSSPGLPEPPVVVYVKEIGKTGI